MTVETQTKETELKEFLDRGGDRVSSVLNPFNGYLKIPDYVLEKAAYRGQRVHDWIRDHIAVIGSWDTLDGISGYIESFMKYWDTIKIDESKILEKRFFNEDLLITGQIDYLAFDGEKNILYDWKTSSSFNQTYPYQGAAYSLLLRSAGIQVDLIKFVMLDKEGNSPKVYDFHPAFYEQEFIQLLGFYRKFFKNQKLPVFED